MKDQHHAAQPAGAELRRRDILKATVATGTAAAVAPLMSVPAQSQAPSQAQDRGSTTAPAAVPVVLRVNGAENRLSLDPCGPEPL